MGMITKRDSLTIRFDKNEVWDCVERFAQTKTSDLHAEFDLPIDSDWTAANAQKDLLSSGPNRELLREVLVAPFDKCWTYYTGETRGFHARPVEQTMRHFRDGNFALSVIRKMDVVQPWQHSFCVDEAMIHHAVSMKEGNYVQPLYLDENAVQIDALEQTERTINFDPKLYAAICEAAGIDPANTAGPEDDFRAATGDARPSEVKVFDYIYGVLHSPDYRETFAEFLKIDFPRIPYPTSPDVFRHVSEKGEAMRRLHLMEPAAIGEVANPFMGEVEEGEESNLIASGFPKWEQGHVWINQHQYFEDVPETAWNFHIGGYQPAQKWLKDRKGRKLAFADFQHYQRIVKILLETDLIMREIELPLEVEG